MRATNWTQFACMMLATLMTGWLFGCADSSWEGVRRRDTVASYHQFLRDHANSPHAREAQERLDYLRVRTRPGVEGFEIFRATYPESILLESLRQEVEPAYFEVARKLNTPEAYRSFLRDYPNAALEDRARGNLQYVEEVRDHPSEDRLRSFAQRYPASDFIEEARRTLKLLESRQETHISRLAVRVDVSPNVEQPERVRRGFAGVVARHYQELGVEVAMVDAGELPPDDADAFMRIDYHEAPASGTFGGRTLISHCRVRLYQGDEDNTIWDRKFEAPADHILQGAYGRDKTLFANSTYRFWEQFFVPISTWATSRSRVAEIEYTEDIVAIDVREERAAVLYANGGIDYLDVSSPLEPELLERYRRERDLTRWSGIKLISDRKLVSYGPDGLELVEMGGTQARRLGQWELPEIGSIAVADVYGETLLFAGTKGVFAIRLETTPLRVHDLLEGEFVGLFVDKPHVYLIRPNYVELTTPKLLLQHMTGGKIALAKEKGFGAYRARRVGDSLYVFGKEEVVEVSVANPKRPKVVASLPADKIGAVVDLVADGGHLYLLGERGLEVASASGQWVEDYIQVRADRAMARKGRFLMLVGGRSLEVYDVAPYQAAAAAAAEE